MGVVRRVQVVVDPVPNQLSVGSDDARAVLDERVLVEQARTDASAFTLLYRAYVGRIHSFAYRRTGSYEEAEEVTAVVFERAWRALPTFSWKGGGFEPWLFRIAANELITHHRRRARVHSERVARVLHEMAEELREDPDLAALLEVDDLEERAARLREAIGTLPPRYQQVITLRYLAGLSAEDAAAAMGCSKGTIAVVLHRAMAALRRAMDVETVVQR